MGKMAKRKRRPGGGRKPHGEFPGKSAAFTTRIQPATRRALDEAARMTGRRSVSAMAEYILKQGLAKPSGEPHNSALANAIAVLAENIERDTKKSWREDPFTGMALRYAVEHLLLQYAPAPPEGAPMVPPAIDEAASKMPPEFAQRFRTPAGFANTLTYNLILEITQASSSAPTNEWSLPFFFNEKPAQLALIGRELGSANNKRKSK
jgi:hypothetical protein